MEATFSLAATDQTNCSGAEMMTTFLEEPMMTSFVEVMDQTHLLEEVALT